MANIVHTSKEFKRCPRCGTTQPLTPRFWGKNLSDGWCRPCKNTYEKARRDAKRKPVPRVVDLGTVGRQEPIPCNVVVIEDQHGNRRALRYYEWYAGEPAPPHGWRVVGTGSKLLGMRESA